MKWSMKKVLETKRTNDRHIKIWSGPKIVCYIRTAWLIDSKIISHCLIFGPLNYLIWDLSIYFQTTPFLSEAHWLAPEWYVCLGCTLPTHSICQISHSTTHLQYSTHAGVWHDASIDFTINPTVSVLRRPSIYHDIISHRRNRSNNANSGIKGEQQNNDLLALLANCLWNNAK